MASIPVRRGDDHYFRQTYKKPDGTIRDLTGCTVLFTVKVAAPKESTEDLDDASAKIRYWWQHDGDTVVSSQGMSLPAGSEPGNGQLIVHFPHELTQTLPIVTSWVYDVQGQTPTDAIRTWDEGKFTVSIDVTRRTSPEPTP